MRLFLVAGFVFGDNQPTGLSLISQYITTTADVVNIALDGQHQDLAGGFDTCVAQNRLQDRHGALHRFGGDHHFGHKVFADLEETTHFLKRRNQSIEENLQRVHPQVDAFLREFFGDRRSPCKCVVI